MRPWERRRPWVYRWADWCQSHPRTVLYLLVTTTLNLLVDLLVLVVK